MSLMKKLAKKSGLATAVGAIGGALIKKSGTKKAAKAQAKAQDKATAVTKAATDRARRDATALFESSGQNQIKGFQGALDIFNRTTPDVLDLFQKGNTQAQKALLSGLDLQTAALLGNPVDLSQLKPVKIGLPEFTPTQLPDFQTSNQVLNQPPQFDFSKFLRGGRIPGGR